MECLLLLIVLQLVFGANHVQETYMRCKNSDGQSNFCSNVEDSCYTLFQKDGSIKSEGCFGELEVEAQIDCQSGSSTCQICHANDCNGKVEQNKPLTCHVCSKYSAKCRLPDESTVKTCDSVDDICFTQSEDVGQNTRGCTTSPCNNSTCLTCNVNNCNGNIFPKNRRWCLDIHNKQNVCSKVDDICVTIFDGMTGEATSAGCLNAIEMESYRKCYRGERTCQSCESNGCNTKRTQMKPLECHLCDGTDDKCTTSASDAPLTTCPLEDYCVTVLEDDSTNSRGCHKKNCDLLKECRPCDTDKCNNNTIYPSRYPKHCYQCSGDGCSEDQEGAPSPCKFHKTARLCYESVIERITSRGCIESWPSTDPLCPDYVKCSACAKDGCNYRTTKLTSQLYCYQCTENDETCGHGNTTHKCNSVVYLGENETCFSVKNKTLRGCTLDAAPGTCDGDACDICLYDNCNKLKLNDASKSTSSSILASRYLILPALIAICASFFK